MVIDEEDNQIVIAVTSEALDAPMEDAVAESKGKKGKKGKPDPEDETDIIWVTPERKHEAILDEDGNNSLITSALNLMNAADQTADAVKAKKVALDLIMLGIAELQAMRVANVATTAIILEEKLYSPENLRELKKPSQISDSLHQLNSTLKESIGYIQTTMSRIKFDTVEGYLREIVDGAQAGDSPKKAAFTKEARQVLDKISSGEDFDSIIASLGSDEDGESKKPKHKISHLPH